MSTRRDFVKRSAILGGALGTGALTPDLGAGLAGSGAGGAEPVGASWRPPKRRLRVLILGGTGFIGPHLVYRALSRGHEVSVFNRGRSEPRLHADIFQDVENLVGDRDDDLSALEGKEWDVVIDNSGYTPEQVAASAELLAGAAQQYIFTSTRGVYAGFTHSPMDEDAPVGIDGVPSSEWTGYGPLKALSEREVERYFPEGASILRPPIITGPGDHTDRFTFWYERVNRGGEVLAPGSPDDPIQFVDVRDVVDFMIHVAEEGTTGVFNVGGPASPLTTAGFLHGLRATTGSPVSFTWVDWDFLEEHGLEGGSEIAAWRPPTGENLNYGRTENRRAIEAGMTFRPLAVTAMDTRDWWQETQGADGGELRSGYSKEKEAEVLAAHRRAEGGGGAND